MVGLARRAGRGAMIPQRVPVVFPGAPRQARFTLLIGPCGADRRDLRPATRDELRRLARSSAGDAGDAMEIEETPRGPVGRGRWRGLGLSVAYASHLALVGVARGWRVGVDLAEARPIADWRLVADLYLDPGVAARLAATPAADQAAAFAAAWARREADLKCLGLGLVERGNAVDRPLRRFATAIGGFACAAVSLEPARWRHGPVARTAWEAFRAFGHLRRRAVLTATTSDAP